MMVLKSEWSVSKKSSRNSSPVPYPSNIMFKYFLEEAKSISAKIRLSERDILQKKLENFRIFFLKVGPNWSFISIKCKEQNIYL